MTAKNKVTPSILLTFLVIVGLTCLVSAKQSHPHNRAKRHPRAEKLQFRSNGKFKIVQFTDMHFGEDLGNDRRTMEQQTKILQWEQPDFVAVTGDSVSAYSQDDESCISEGGVANCYASSVRAMIEANVPWAFTIGNHDEEGDLTREQLLKHDMSYALSMSQMGPNTTNGYSNYVLHVFGSSSASSNTVITNLYFMDTGNRGCMGVKGWGCLAPSQVEWYRNTSMTLRTKLNRTVPSLAFFHIANPEYMYSLNNLEAWGHREENVCCSSLNTGIFAAFKEMQDVRATFVGHDHNNDYRVNYQNITLHYGRKTGFGGYFGKHFQTGARVIELTESPFKIETWIRQADGTVDTQTNKKFELDDPQLKCCSADA